MDQGDGIPDEPTRSRAGDDSTLKGESLLIGIVAEGNPNNFTDPTNRLLRGLQLAAQRASEKHPARYRVQSIIYIPSNLVKPGFEGVRLGTFTRARNQQNVLIAVPERLETSLTDFLAGALEDGFQLALERLRRKHISGDSLDSIAQAGAQVVDELRRGHVPIRS